MFTHHPSRITYQDLVGLGVQYRFPRGCRLMEPAPMDHAATPPRGFVAISVQHLEAGLRFPVPPYLIELLNVLKLAPFQLTPNSYTQFSSLAIFFRKYGLPFPNPGIIRHLYTFKATSRGQPRDGIYYASPRTASIYKDVVPKGDAKGKSNVGHYKTNWFYASCPSLSNLLNFSFRAEPGRTSLKLLSSLCLRSRAKYFPFLQIFPLQSSA